MRSSKHTPLDKGVATTWTTNGIWSRDRLVDSGLLINPMCELCKTERDSVVHRLYFCNHPAAVECRGRHLDRRQLAEARDRSDELLFRRGWCVHPDNNWPAAGGTLIKVEKASPTGWDTAVLDHTHGRLPEGTQLGSTHRTGQGERCDGPCALPDTSPSAARGLKSGPNGPSWGGAPYDS